MGPLHGIPVIVKDNYDTRDLPTTAGSLSFEGAMEGVDWYLKPDFSRVDGGALLAALGQVFYSIGVGMASQFHSSPPSNPRQEPVRPHEYSEPSETAPYSSLMYR